MTDVSELVRGRKRRVNSPKISNSAGEPPRESLLKSAPLRRADPTRRSAPIGELSGDDYWALQNEKIEKAAKALMAVISEAWVLDRVERVLVTRAEDGGLLTRFNGRSQGYSDWRAEDNTRDPVSGARPLCRREFDNWDFSGGIMARNPWEHPEQSYRRGYQQGSGEVYHALEKAGLLGDSLRERLRDFVYGPVARWRFMSRHPFGRRLARDRAPRLDLSDYKRGRR